MNNSKHIIQVAPLIHLPIDKTQVFSYLFHEPIKRGSLVEIPFYNRVILGIALENKNNFPRHGNFKLKKIKRIIREDIISKKQIKFAEKLADFYFSPLGTILKLMVPKIIKTKKHKKSQLNSKLKSLPKNWLADKIIKLRNKEIALIGPKRKRDEVIFSIIQSILQKNKQCLYLFSEILPAVLFFTKLKSFFSAEDIVLVHGEISKRKIFEAWNRIKNGKTKLIVATKTGLFLPFHDLGAIIIEESDDISHKQWDMNPRYNARRAAQILSDVHGKKIIHSNSLLSIELQERERKEPIKIINIKRNKWQEPEIKIVNIFEEKKSVDFPIGKELYKSLSNITNKKGKTLLIINRKGFSNYSICQNCKTILRCPDCDRALVYFEEKEKYKCLHCSHKVDLLSACPVCGACQFSHQGAGIQLVEKKVKRLFPRARILRLDADVLKLKKKKEKILKDLVNGNFNILVGTQIALKLGGFLKFDLTAFPNFDALGSFPDFNARELVFAMLIQAKEITQNNGSVIIQTAYSNNFLLVSFQNQQEKAFFEKEAKERKKMSYPPFARLIKIFYRNKSRKKVNAEAQKIFNLLEALANSSIDVSEPYDPFAAKKRGYYYKNILIKFSSDTVIRQSPVFSILDGLKKGWAVDIEPVSTV